MTLLDRRRAPFAVLGGVIVLVCVAVLALPAPGLVHARRNRSFSSDQAGWAYRLLAIASVAQAAYGGFVVLRADRMPGRLVDRDGAPLDDGVVVARAARDAAWMVGFTLLYGCAALAVTAERGGFWLFVLVALAQALWYYRSVGQIAAWLATTSGSRSQTGDVPQAWRPDDNYVPPVTRGLVETDPPPRRP